MSDSYETQVNDLRAELAEAKAANEALKEQVVAEQQAEFQTRIESLESTIAELQESLAAKDKDMQEKDKKMEEQEAAMKEKMAEMKKKDEEMAEMKKKAMTMKRKAQLEEAGYASEEALATVEQFENVDEATFDNIIAAIHKRPVSYMLDQSVEDVKEEAEATKLLEEEVDSAEASEEVLEEVEEVQEVAIAEAMGEEDPAENLRAVASEWIGSFLQTTNKK